MSNPNGNKAVTFEELFDLEQIQQIQDAFAEATNVASIITTPDGVPITKPSNFRYLCMEVIRKTDKGLHNCYKSDSIIGAVSSEGRAVVSPCLSGGLWDGGASIHFGTQHVANWLIGQVVDESFDRDSMIAYADEIGADREEFARALADVPYMNVEQFGLVAQTLYLIAQQLSQLAFQSHYKDQQIKELKQQLAAAAG
jgi:ligand-binding sensor protein